MNGTLQRDRSTPLPSIVSEGSSRNDFADSSTPQQSRGTAEEGEEQTRDRVEQLEGSILFLQQQHKETLHQLHSQTEQLKKENRGNLHILL